MAKPQKITLQPAGTETHLRTAVQLDGVFYQFRFYTNKADESWYFDIATMDAADVVRGLALVAGVNLLAPYRHFDFPPGVLWVEDLGLGGKDPGLNDFKEGRAELRYLPVLS